MQREKVLINSIEQGHVDVVKYLIEKGCNFAHTDTKKQSALNWAKKYNRT